MVNNPATAYKRGRQFEYRVKKDMGERGYMVLRSPASKSKVDLYCMRKGELVFIQCKLHGQIGVEEWNEFLKTCKKVDARPIIAENQNGKILYSEIFTEKDGTKRRSDGFYQRP